VFDVPIEDNAFEDVWSGSSSVAPEGSTWDFLPKGSQIFDSILGTVATSFASAADAAKPRIAYELNRPVITAGSQGSQNWLVLLVALGVGVYLLTR